MCACGCLVLVGLVAAVAYCVVHGLWIVAAGVVVLAGVLGWLGVKAMRKTEKPGGGRDSSAAGN